LSISSDILLHVVVVFSRYFLSLHMRTTGLQLLLEQSVLVAGMIFRDRKDEEEKKDKTRTSNSKNRLERSKHPIHIHTEEVDLDVFSYSY